MAAFTAVFETTGALCAEFSTDEAFDAGFANTVEVGKPVYYDGTYSFTPTQEAQTVAIYGKTATQDITIGPIPSTYGRITWNGAALRVE